VLKPSTSATIGSAAGSDSDHEHGSDIDCGVERAGGKDAERRNERD